MAREKELLTNLEAEIMNIVWEKGKVSVRDVYEVIRSNRTVAYTTVMTVLSNLTEKGVVKRSQKGRAYIYQPSVSKKEAAQYSVDRLLQKFFNGSPRSLVAHLIDIEAISPEELSSLQEMLNSKLEESER